MQKSNYKCKVCSNSDKNLSVTVLENMYSSGNSYDYFICGRCNCLQISEKPSDTENLYPNDYYSFSKTSGFFIRKLTYLRDRYVIYGIGIAGYFLSKFAKGPDIVALASVIKNTDVRVLDVGAGAGNFIKRLKAIGIKNSMGIDPYINQDIIENGEIIVKKSNISNINETFDIVTFNHSYEHMEDFLDVLKHTRKILSEDGICILRIPVFPSYAWYTYREDWVQIDAPRHINIFSIQAIANICNQCGFIIKYIYDDSNYFQFVGSEINRNKKQSTVIESNLYCRIIKHIKNLRLNRIAYKLNKIGQGDQKCFILVRDNSN